MRLRRRAEGFNLAFLDIMSCGLVRIILVFYMLVKHNVDNASLETELLQADLERLLQLQEQLQAQLSDSARRRTETEARIADVRPPSRPPRMRSSPRPRTAAERSEKSALEDAIKTIDIPDPARSIPSRFREPARRPT